MSKRNKRRTALVAQRKALPQALSSVSDSREGWITLHDFIPGSFQRDVPIDPYRVQSNWAIFACQTLIAADIGKLGIMLVEWNPTTYIYEEVDSAAFSPFLRKPNGYQTWPKFVQHWILSKVSNGNAYLLKERDARNVVVAAHVLNPHRVMPLIAPDGSVYYQLHHDDLAGIPQGDVVVPASEIMHDRMWCLYHPLIGLSPIFACGLAATQGLEIQRNSARFFRNASRPGGMLVAPSPISEKLAAQYKSEWEKNYAAGNEGRTAVLGNGLKYEALSQSAVDSELVAQLKMSAEMICSTYHVPAYKVGVGALPTYQNAEVLDQIYYDDCLQTLINDAEKLLDEGLGLPSVKGRSLCVKFDLDDLLRMDSAAQIDTLNSSVKGGWLAPNEARAKRNLKPVVGGESPMMQQQQFSLAALKQRDDNKPFAKAARPAPATPAGGGDPAAADAAAKRFTAEVLASAAAILDREVIDVNA